LPLRHALILLLLHSSFTHGKAHILNSAQPPIIMDVGLLGVAIQDDGNFSGFDGRVVSWNAFCVEFVTDFGAFFDVPACESCGDRSKTLVGSIIMSLLFSIPSFTTDILRFYPDYDVSRTNETYESVEQGESASYPLDCCR
jgi:hypothetical protein